ncbi:MAG: hypothetical protein KIT80_09280 [Chitinophagaceae bacterium]|nr:hypothetical protein [Chitinophagaceae bacterium]MCW5927090.1 hypothetical protein [Chitinophagaceae bacterium]
MPNWCLTIYIIEGDPGEINDLEEKLRGLQEGNVSLAENAFGKTWLGNVVKLYGGDPDEIACRGNFEEWQRINDNTLELETSTAWVEMRETWDFVCRQYSSLRYYFRAEEPGGEYFVTNDADRKYFRDRFFMDQPEEGTLYFETEKALFAEVSGRTGTDISNWEELRAAIKKYNEADEDDNPITAGAFAVV